MRRMLILFTAGALTLVVASQVAARPSAGPTNLQDPTISGPAIVGRTLDADKGIWSGAGISYKYQWLRCKAEATSDSSSGSCANISGANEETYLVVSGDLGKRLRVRVTGSTKGGNTPATSAPTSVITTEGGTPASSSAPRISGSALVGSTLSGTTGTWVGDQPITYSYFWLRCDAAGNACKAISGATKSTYKVTQKETGKTVRLRVQAKNARGKADAFSLQTDVVTDAGGGEGGIITLPSGEKSVDVKDVPKGERLIVDKVAFDPNPLSSPTAPILVRIKVKDTRGYVVRNAIVFIRSTPLLTSGGDNFPTATDGWVSYQLVPRAPLELKTGYSIQFFAKAYRKGDDPLAGISGTRLVQVATKG